MFLWLYSRPLRQAVAAMQVELLGTGVCAAVVHVLQVCIDHSLAPLKSTQDTALVVDMETEALQLACAAMLGNAGVQREMALRLQRSFKVIQNKHSMSRYWLRFLQVRVVCVLVPGGGVCVAL